ncbi:MAG: hypothetical protein APR54_02915 [Candidatus Cloacimonas sp. SDB]|nr:MAG: hypothetical protein APR54_02915 [Candidatus Cloacimonas sp. SDB]
MNMMESLRNLKNVDDHRKLFIDDLNYDYTSGSLFSALSEKLQNEVTSIEQIADLNGFLIIYCRLPKLLKGIERPISEQISKSYPNNLLIFADEQNQEFHFTNLKTTEQIKSNIPAPYRPFRRIVIGEYENLRTAAERIELLKIESDDESAVMINIKHDKAFDVEAVSRDFYKDYVHFYRGFRQYLMNNNKLTQPIADEYTQTIFNRIFFLFFVQKKGYLQRNPNYICEQFKTIGNKNYYKDFLIPLFEKISNNAENNDFQDIPFLNGGLFEFTDDEKKIRIANSEFQVVLDGLFTKYNFTVREDTEYEKEIAIDPEMLGTIFERLILGLEQNKYKDIPDARRASGSYYTPKFIVSFMVKQSLLNDLANQKTLRIDRKKLKELVFNIEAEKLSDSELNKIRQRLLDIRIVDPAVGSGAYPVGILLKIIEIIDAIDSAINPAEKEKQNYRYDLKRQIIENCIYGVDLQEKAVHLTNLRLWLSLIVDLEVENIEQIPPLPNLDFHIYQGDSLISKIAGYDFDQERKLKPDTKGLELLKTFQAAKKEFQEIVNLEKKNKAKQKINKLKTDYLTWFLNKKKSEEQKYLESIAEGQGNFFEEDEQNLDLKQESLDRIASIEKKLSSVHLLSEHFNWGLDFFDEIEAKGGFDIVIANPPYGIKVDVKTRDEFQLNSKDSYGIFVSLGLKILKPGGTLCYIMSDTWQTIKSHKNLRNQLLKETDTQFLISVPADTFGATVNTGVYTFIKRTSPRLRFADNAENRIIAADLSPFKIKQPNGSWNTGNLEAGFELLAELADFDSRKDGETIYSERDFAVFAYKQKLIPRFSNHSFFIASPKLFALMEDTGRSEMVEGKTIYKVDFNGKELELVKLGKLYKGFGGIKSYEGFHDKYMRTIEEGRYKRINEDLLATHPLTEEEKLSGITGKKNFITMMKFGDHVRNNTLLNFYQPITHFYQWTKQSILELDNLNCLRNKNLYFGEGIFFSVAGSYSPCFRYSKYDVFDINAHLMIIDEELDTMELLAKLCSTFTRYLLLTYINHTAGTNTQDIEELILTQHSNSKLNLLSKQIIEKLEKNCDYNYTINEQLEIDRLVYEMYNLNEEDIKEVENWYWRRYPKLAEAIERNMKAKQREKF